MDLNTIAVGIIGAVIMALILTVLFVIIARNNADKPERIPQRSIIASSIAVIVVTGIGLLIVLA